MKISLRIVATSLILFSASAFYAQAAIAQSVSFEEHGEKPGFGHDKVGYPGGGPNGDESNEVDKDRVRVKAKSKKSQRNKNSFLP